MPGQVDGGAGRVLACRDRKALRTRPERPIKRASGVLIRLPDRGGLPGNPSAGVPMDRATAQGPRREPCLFTELPEAPKGLSRSGLAGAGPARVGAARDAGSHSVAAGNAQGPGRGRGSHLGRQRPPVLLRVDTHDGASQPDGAGREPLRVHDAGLPAPKHVVDVHAASPRAAGIARGRRASRRGRRLGPPPRCAAGYRRRRRIRPEANAPPRRRRGGLRNGLPRRRLCREPGEPSRRGCCTQVVLSP